MGTKLVELTSQAASLLLLANASSTLLLDTNASAFGSLPADGLLPPLLPSLPPLPPSSPPPLPDPARRLIDRVTAAASVSPAAAAASASPAPFEAYLASIVHKQPSFKLHMATGEGAYLGVRADPNGTHVHLARRPVGGCLGAAVYTYDALGIAVGGDAATASADVDCSWQVRAPWSTCRPRVPPARAAPACRLQALCVPPAASRRAAPRHAAPCPAAPQTTAPRRAHRASPRPPRLAAPTSPWHPQLLSPLSPPSLLAPLPRPQPQHAPWSAANSSCNATAETACWSAPFAVEKGAAIALQRRYVARPADDGGGGGGEVLLAVEVGLSVIEEYMQSLMISTEASQTMDVVLLDAAGALLASAHAYNQARRYVEYAQPLPEGNPWQAIDVALDNDRRGLDNPKCALSFAEAVEDGSFCGGFQVGKPLCQIAGPLPVHGACALASDCEIATVVNGSWAQTHGDAHPLPEGWRIRLMMGKSDYYPGFDEATTLTLAFSISCGRRFDPLCSLLLHSAPICSPLLPCAPLCSLVLPCAPLCSPLLSSAPL